MSSEWAALVIHCPVSLEAALPEQTRALPPSVLLGFIGGKSWQFFGDRGAGFWPRLFYSLYK